MSVVSRSWALACLLAACGEGADPALEVAAANIGGGQSAVCDRQCLLGTMQDYLDALVAHDPSALAFSPQLKMTDNGVAAKPGDGLWKTVSALQPGARLDFADPVLHNVATQTVVKEGDKQVMYQVRLKVEAGLITEVESMTVRADNAWFFFFDPANLVPQPAFLEVPDPSTRMSRDELLAVTQLYLDYLDGQKNGWDVPFDAECSRYENGVVTASGLLSFQLQSWFFDVTRRVLIVDEEAGITWGMFPFWQGDTALVVGEAFKIVDGKIMMIQAVMSYLPATAWD